MKKFSIYFMTLIIFLGAGFSSFTSNDANTSATLNPPDEFAVLLNYFETNNNFINSDLAPAIINAHEVKSNLKNAKYHIIDIRNESWFEYGHIKKAHNVKAADLLAYFANDINPATYDKIVLTCYSGQSAAYYTALLRLAGYDNVYSMKWGMSSWRLDFAENSWLKNVKNENSDKLEATGNIKVEQAVRPILNTGKTEAKEILKARLEKLFATPYKEYIITSSDVFENSGDYYVVNYWNKDSYNNGHIPGAVQYEPGWSLSSTTDLYTIPADKKVAVYCATGQTAAHAVAYLNVLGYDVGNIGYGANSFMNKEMKAKEMGAFTKKEINTYPVIE